MESKKHIKSIPSKGKKQQPIALSKVQNTNNNPFRKYYYLLGVFTFIIFANTIGNDYNLDDIIVTNGHPLTSQGVSSIGEIFTSPYYSDDMGHAYGYRPMVHLSFALEHELFGEKPGAGHFINVILFALCVVLFFKLLVKWVGEKNVLFAGVTTLIFAVHPIHTEVVASLKNRDEILAFLFVIWAGLSAHKFLENGKWTSIISIVILFSLAMLSKKSVYPMAVVLPAAIILLKDISVKQLVILGFSLIIPAAVIGSELRLVQMGVMIILPITALTALYIIKHFCLWKEKLIRQIRRLRLDITLVCTILIIGLIAVLLSSAITLFFIIPLSFWLFKINFEYGLMTLIFLLLGLDFFWLKRYEIQLLPLLIGLGYGFYCFLESKRINKLWIVIAIITVIYYLINNYELGTVGLFIDLILFILLLYKKTLWAVLFSILTFVIAIFLYGINLYALEILLFSILFLFYKKTNNKSWIQYAAVIGLAINFSVVEYQNIQFNRAQSLKAVEAEQPLPSEEIQRTKRHTQSILREGRKLEYVENTLVAPYSKNEKIATGFLTLGEYVRLHIFPSELSFYYGFSKIKTVDFKYPIVWISIIVHFLLICLAIWQLKKRPLIAIGVMWYIFSILLFSNWVEFVAGMVGERLAFTASAGFCILVVALLFWIKPNFSFSKPGIVGIIFGLVIIVFSARTIVRNTDWKDAVTLMGHDIKHLGNSAQANNLYAINLMAYSTTNEELLQDERLKMQTKAIAHFDQATKIYPKFYNAYVDKGRAALYIGDYNTAIKTLKKAIQIDSENDFAYYILLENLEQHADFKDYQYWAVRLLEITKNEETYGIAAKGYFLNNNFQKSKEVLLEGIQIYPNSEALNNNLRLVEANLNNSKSEI